MMELHIPLPTTTQEWALLVGAIGLCITFFAFLFGPGIVPRLRARFATPVTSKTGAKKGLIGFEKKEIGTPEEELRLLISPLYAKLNRNYEIIDYMTTFITAKPGKYRSDDPRTADP